MKKYRMAHEWNSEAVITETVCVCVCVCVCVSVRPLRSRTRGHRPNKTGCSIVRARRDEPRFDAVGFSVQQKECAGLAPTGPVLSACLSDWNNSAPT
jgi:hypothetical protein